MKNQDEDNVYSDNSIVLESFLIKKPPFEEANKSCFKKRYCFCIIIILQFHKDGGINGLHEAFKKTVDRGKPEQISCYRFIF